MGTPLMMDNLILIGIAFLALLVIGLIFSRLYRRSSKERAFVRTGLGGQKVVMDGGALVFPVFHETILVNMNTLKLEVTRFGKDSLFTKDRMRVDVVVAFFVRVVPTKEGIANAAQTLGVRTMDPDQLSQLVEDKFVDALRAAAVAMTMQELLDKRQDFIQGVQNAVSEDLLKNGLELESVSLTRIDQTAMQFFDPNNAFDAEGLTRLTEQTQRRSRERNEIEQDTTVAISQKNFEAKQLQLEIDRQKRFAELAQSQEVSIARSRAGRHRCQGAGRARCARPKKRKFSRSARSARRRSRSNRPCGSARSKRSGKCRSRPSSSSASRRSQSRKRRS